MASDARKPVSLHTRKFFRLVLKDCLYWLSQRFKYPKLSQTIRVAWD